MNDERALINQQRKQNFDTAMRHSSDRKTLEGAVLDAEARLHHGAMRAGLRRPSCLDAS